MTPLVVITISGGKRRELAGGGERWPCPGKSLNHLPLVPDLLWPDWRE